MSPSGPLVFGRCHFERVGRVIANKQVFKDSLSSSDSLAQRMEWPHIVAIFRQF